MEIYCGQLTEEYVGKDLTLNGWCRYIRDHGNKIFIDLADRTGICQLVFDGSTAEQAKELGREAVIRVYGTARHRDSDTIDKENPTGRLEILVNKLDIINHSNTPPFEITEEKEKFLASEELRLRYRYLDLRRKNMVENIEFRDAVTKRARKFFWDNGFMELETPTLVKDTYETGARPFLVPSRTKKGTFYSLPQSPQIYKQIAMVSGLDKYFQVARAFRDEDQREDRQPEFTQLDFEVSFKDESYVMSLVESLIKSVLVDVMKKEIKTPFKRIGYPEAMSKYGSDKPDLRYDYQIFDVTEELKESEYNVISRVIQAGGHVKAVRFPADYGSGGITKDFMLSAVETAKANGLKGLTWVFVKDGRLQSVPESIAAAISKSEATLIKKADAHDGDVIVLGADPDEGLLLQAMGKVRKFVGDRIGKFNEPFCFVWVVDFPLFEADTVTGKLKPAHNPFTAPFTEDIKLLDSAPEKCVEDSLILY